MTSILMDCVSCGTTINTWRPPHCWDCWCVIDEENAQFHADLIHGVDEEE